MSWRKQHRYLTLVADHIRGQIVWDGRDAATADPYGFHSANAAIALIMLSCGPITLTLPHESP